MVTSVAHNGIPGHLIKPPPQMDPNGSCAKVKSLPMWSMVFSSSALLSMGLRKRQQILFLPQPTIFKYGALQILRLT